MKIFVKAIVLTGLAALRLASTAEAAGEHTSPYAGQESREIKTLSPEDVEELRDGAGWGLARAAELNGLPGPKHLLEMAEEIDLTAKQREQIEKLYSEMKEQAVPLGLQLIEEERALNDSFAQRSIDEDDLRRQLDAIGKTLSDLRYVHLSTHLKALPLLEQEQVTRYNELRGYDSTSSPEEVPAGHDPEMWKRHHSR